MYWLCISPDELEMIINKLEDARVSTGQELTDISDLIVKLLFIQKTEAERPNKAERSEI